MKKLVNNLEIGFIMSDVLVIHECKVKKIIHSFYDHETVCSFFKLTESAETRGYPLKILMKTVLTEL